MPSFYIPLSGLDADSTSLNTIANNLANMNTTGFKSQTTNFSDLFYQQVGSNGAGDEIQAGTGVQVASNSTDFTGGSISNTGVSTDAAIDGAGFFVLDNNGSQLYSRDGHFQTSATGVLESSDGLAVMGYGVKNGAINTSGGLVDINIPTGQVMNPLATTTFSMATNLDSQDAIGSSTSASDQTKIYDSLGNSYEATVTYTKTGTNTWTYSVTVPDSLTAAPETASTATTMNVAGATPTTGSVTIPAGASVPAPTAWTGAVPSASTVSGANTIYTYNFGAGGTVDPGTTFSIGGVQPTFVGGTLLGLQAGITALAQPGVSASINGNVLTVTAPTATVIGGNLTGDFAGNQTNYAFNTGGTVDPGSNLVLSGQTAAGAPVSITAPTVTSGENITSYATALTQQLAKAGIVNVTVTPNLVTNQLQIVGANLASTGSVSQDLTATTTNYDFGSTATVDPATNFTITGQTATGATATITAPTVTAGETVGQYALALTAAIGPAGANLVGVTVGSSGGQLTITGANMTSTGAMSEDLQAATIAYNFGSSNGAVATVDPTTNLTITGLTSNGSSATIAAPTIPAGQSIAHYAAALNTALATAGIAGVTVSSTAAGQLNITGANFTTAGSVVQDPVASATAAGTLTFNANGQLSSPGANLSGITFSGLSDGAAPLNLTWSLFNPNGTANISQTASADATSATSQNGYTTGTNTGFTITGSNGIVAATYSNGQTQDVGQIAVATVSNQQAMVDVGSTEYEATSASGSASVGIAGTGERGTVEGSSLEASNVNISAEFSDLIVAQRAFEANSKAVTTFDTVTQETINMIH